MGSESPNLLRGGEGVGELRQRRGDGVQATDEHHRVLPEALPPLGLHPALSRSPIMILSNSKSDSIHKKRKKGIVRDKQSPWRRRRVVGARGDPRGWCRRGCGGCARTAGRRRRGWRAPRWRSPWEWDASKLREGSGQRLLFDSVGSESRRGRGEVGEKSFKSGAASQRSDRIGRE